MFALYLWTVTAVGCFALGWMCKGLRDQRPKRNRFIGTPDPRCERAGNIYEFRRRAS